MNKKDSAIQILTKEEEKMVEEMMKKTERDRKRDVKKFRPTPRKRGAKRLECFGKQRKDGQNDLSVSATKEKGWKKSTKMLKRLKAFHAQNLHKDHKKIGSQISPTKTVCLIHPKRSWLTKIFFPIHFPKIRPTYPPSYSFPLLLSLFSH